MSPKLTLRALSSWLQRSMRAMSNRRFRARDVISGLCSVYASMAFRICSSFLLPVTWYQYRNTFKYRERRSLRSGRWIGENQTQPPQQAAGQKQRCGLLDLCRTVQENWQRSDCGHRLLAYLVGRDMQEAAKRGLKEAEELEWPLQVPEGGDAARFRIDAERTGVVFIYLSFLTEPGHPIHRRKRALGLPGP